MILAENEISELINLGERKKEDYNSLKEKLDFSNVFILPYIITIYCGFKASLIPRLFWFAIFTYEFHLIFVRVKFFKELGIMQNST